MKNLRLKSLELNGYKTFATRSLFEFGAPITAVVGPNGSGKSNIADALRWVLGEQSYGLLRGRKTEDMIFSGSETKPRAGMAGVTITFDNNEGWLPIDFSEVAVTRRAYRDGQNEYLINNQKVRLKDVGELLAASGLSERTYTVIGQGLVDAALTLKSDERRRLFEEAAGIGLYRDRKDQSLRRLDATIRNLERVEDILSELKPRLRTLQKQAERADEFVQLRTNLRATLREWYGYHWNHAQAELHDLRQEADAREANLGATRQKQAELSQELTKLRGLSQDLRVQLNEWHRHLAELHAGREGASRDLAVADERERALLERRAALEEERKRVETELTGLRSRLQEAEQDSKRYEAEVSEAQSQLDESRQALQSRQGAHEERDAKTRALRENLLQLQTHMANSRAQRENLQRSLERNQAEAAELAHTVEQIETDLQEQSARKVEIEATLKTAEAAVASQQGQVSNFQAEIEKLLTQQKKTEADRNQLQTRQAKLSAELKGIEDAEATAAGFAEGAKLLLQAAKEKRLRLGQGTLGRELRVSSEYETAISAALGAYADAVLVNDSDAEAALSLLETGGASATLLPLQSLRLDGRVKSANGQGLLGIAADLVDVSAEFRPAIDLLLGRVLVVEDRRAARRLLQAYPDASQAVTLRGEVFHRAGPIEVRAAKVATGLTRPRQERELRAELERIEKDLNAVESEHTDIVSQIERSEGERKSIALGLELTLASSAAARRDLESHDLEANQLERQLDWFRAQQRTLATERTKAEGEISTLTEKENQLTTQLAGVETEFEAHMASVVEEPMDEQHAQVAHWEMRLAVGQRALQEAQRRAGERQQSLQRAEAQLTAQQDRHKELEDQLQVIGLEKVELGNRGGSVGGEIEAVQAKIAPAEAELAASDAQLTNLQKSETQALQGLSAAERNNTQAQIALARQQESLETLRGRIEDDFGLVAFQYDEQVSGPNPLPLGELVEKLPVVHTLAPELEETLKEQRTQIRRLGSVNPEAQREYVEVRERVEGMEAQVKDLRAAEVDLKQIITELDTLMEKEFQTTFEKVAAEFKIIFARLFNGGSARLLLTEGEDMAATGIDIEARLPGKRAQRLALLSGGERSLTAAALVFALLKASPTPFCVMDEVDAMLDEANVGRFTDVLRELSQDTQFVVITHNRNTVQAADVIYGITMGRDTASQVISLRLDQVDERYSA
jgi:chromosome segregation protein